jgi:hypothetical protein
MPRNGKGGPPPAGLVMNARTGLIGPRVGYCTTIRAQVATSSEVTGHQADLAKATCSVTIIQQSLKKIWKESKNKAERDR